MEDASDMGDDQTDIAGVIVNNDDSSESLQVDCFVSLLLDI